MAIRVSEVISVDVSLNTDRINKDVSKVNRLLKQVQASYTGVSKELKVLDAAFKTGKMTQVEYLAIQNRLNLASARARQRLKDEAKALKDLEKVRRDAANRNNGLKDQNNARGPERADARRKAGTTKEFSENQAALKQRLKAFKEEAAAIRAKDAALKKTVASQRAERVEIMKRKGLAVQADIRREKAAVDAHRVALNQRLAAYKRTKHELIDFKAVTTSYTRAVQGMKTALATVIGPLVVLYTTFELLKKSINLSAELDQARAKFKVFTGSAEQAETILENLRELSSQTPVSFQSGTRAAATLLQFGVSAQKVTAVVRQLSEITGGNQERLESLSLAYAQSQAAGRLMGQELLQMVNAGFNPLLQISKETGESFQSLKKRMEEGGISSELVAEQFEKATAEGGQFHGLMAEVADTTAGRLIKMQTEFEKLGTAIGDTISPLTDLFAIEVTKELSAARQMAGAFDDMGKNLEVVFKWYRLIRAATPSIVTALSQMSLRFQPNLGQRPEGQNVSGGEFDRLATQLEKDKEKAKEAGDEIKRLGLILSFTERVGEGFFTEEQLERVKEIEAIVKRMTAEQAKQTRIDEAFEDIEEDAQGDRLKHIYGDDAGLVEALRDQSVDDERVRIDKAIARGASYEVVVLQANKAARAEAERLKILQDQNAALDEQAKDKEKADEKNEKRRKDMDDMVWKAAWALQLQKDLLTFTEKEARVRQLMREQGFARKEASEIALLEKREEILKEMNKIQEKSSDGFAKELAMLQVALNKGAIDQPEFMRQRDKLLKDNLKSKNVSGFADSAEKGSQEAFKAFYSGRAGFVQKQLAETQKQTLLLQNQRTVDTERNRLLRELNDNKPGITGT